MIQIIEQVDEVFRLHDIEANRQQACLLLQYLAQSGNRAKAGDAFDSACEMVGLVNLHKLAQLANKKGRA